MTEQAYKDTIAFFISFCVEIYKNAHALTGAQAIERLSSSGVLNYLEKHYEAIHTQSAQWILEEIDEFMNAHKAACP